MRFFFDESGSFLEVSSRDHGVSVAVGLGGPDIAVDSLLKDWTALRAALPANELVDGEPKGNRLSAKSRLQVCDLLQAHADVFLCPTILDLSHLSGSDRGLIDALSADLCRLSMAVRNPDEKLDLLNAARTVSTLSVPQMRKLYAWANSAYRTALAVAKSPWASEWSNCRLVFDRVDGVEVGLLPFLLPIWVQMWSMMHRCTLDAEMARVFGLANHATSGLPIPLGPLMVGRVEFADSKVEDGIQIADIAASIIYRAMRSAGDSSEDLAVFGRLWRSCHYTDLGFISPLSEMPDRPTAQKYERLRAEAEYARFAQAWHSGETSFLIGPDFFAHLGWGSSRTIEESLLKPIDPASVYCQTLPLTASTTATGAMWSR